PERAHRQEDDGGGGQRGAEGGVGRRAETISRLLHRRTRVNRLQGQLALVDRRRAIYEGDGRRFREGPVVVRQRVGLLESLRGSAPPARQEGSLKLSIKDLDLRGKRVFIRVDFN